MSRESGHECDVQAVESAGVTYVSEGRGEERDARANGRSHRGVHDDDEVFR